MLQPCLLDRLIDDEPARATESRQERVVSLQRYREAVMRDLLMLFNTPSAPFGSPLATMDHVSGSVLNFGFRSLSGLLITSMDLPDIERQMMRVIRAFEPRIRPETLSVKASVVEGETGRLAFEIEGELWARPVPEHLWLKAVADLNSGAFSFGDRTYE